MSQKMKKPEAGKKQKLGPGRKTWNNFKQSAPIIIGVLLLISLLNSVLTAEDYARLFRGNPWLDSFIGALIGSISGGNPLFSYILGGEFQQQGVSLLAVTAFIITWVTVGVSQLPAESLMLGKRFAIVRNLTAFISAILIAFFTVSLLAVL